MQSFCLQPSIEDEYVQVLRGMVKALEVASCMFSLADVIIVRIVTHWISFVFFGIAGD
jgi:hypothetical protein